MSALRILPCADSPDMASARRCELDVSRAFARHLGQTAAEAAETGYYEVDDGRRVRWDDALRAARSAKVSIAPGDPLPMVSSLPIAETRVQIVNETTLGAAFRLYGDGARPLALNFANGIQPGGGFLSGARAQEEVLCRSSGLYPTLVGDPMYAAHAKRSIPDSSEWAILSPDVPVFRNDDGRSRPVPWPLSFISCAAPFAPRVGQPRAGDLLQARIHRILDIAYHYQYTVLVLGAWGCGAFRNDVARTAADFRAALEQEFAGAFSDVVFAITDWSDERRYLRPFCDAFGSASGDGDRFPMGA